MKKLKSDDILIIVSTAGILIWIASGFFKGMFYFLASYWILVVPSVILYLYLVIGTLSSFFKNGLKGNLIKLVSLILIILASVLVKLNNTELFKSEITLKAVMRDDLSISILTFRKNGKCEYKEVIMFGFTIKHQGKYILNGDTIIFLSSPYESYFLPDTLLLDTLQKAIFRERDKNGTFRTKKEWLNHYKIE